VSLKSIIIPKNVTVIEAFSFRDCTSLKSVSFVDASSIITIGYYAFQRCKMNGTLFFENLSGSLARFAFAETEIQSVKSLGKITKIEGDSNDYTNGIFYNCTELLSVELPSTINEIGGCTFHGCSKLNYIKCISTTPPEISNRTFEYSNDCSIYVPDISLSLYKSATNWSSISSRIKGLSTFTQ
jgi:hypothetical protein